MRKLPETCSKVVVFTEIYISSTTYNWLIMTRTQNGRKSDKKLIFQVYALKRQGSKIYLTRVFSERQKINIPRICFENARISKIYLTRVFSEETKNHSSFFVLIKGDVYLVLCSHPTADNSSGMLIGHKSTNEMLAPFL